MMGSEIEAIKGRLGEPLTKAMIGELDLMRRHVIEHDGRIKALTGAEMHMTMLLSNLGSAGAVQEGRISGLEHHTQRSSSAQSRQYEASKKGNTRAPPLPLPLPLEEEASLSEADSQPRAAELEELATLGMASVAPTQAVEEHLGTPMRTTPTAVSARGLAMALSATVST